jgi:hypothetical protein
MNGVGLIVLAVIIIFLVIIFIAFRGKKPYRVGELIRFSYGGTTITAAVRKIDKRGAGTYYIVADRPHVPQQRKPPHEPLPKVAGSRAERLNRNQKVNIPHEALPNLAAQQRHMRNERARFSHQRAVGHLHPPKSAFGDAPLLKPYAPRPGIPARYPPSRVPRSPKLRHY